MRLLPELSSRVPGHPAHGRLEGMVDHADDIYAGNGAVKADYIKSAGLGEAVSQDLITVHDGTFLMKAL